MLTFYKRNKENVDKILYFILFVVFLRIFFKYLASYLSPLILGYILCVILYPLANMLQVKLKMPIGIASLLSIIFLMLAIGILGKSIISRLVLEVMLYVEELPAYVEEIYAMFDTLNEKYYNVFSILPEELHDSWEAIVTNLAASITSSLGAGVKNGSMVMVKNLPNILMVLVLGLISAFFLICDKKNIEAFIYKQLPDSAKKILKVVRDEIWGATIGYFKAQLILMLVTLMVCVVGLSILRYPHAVVVGLIISVIDVLPVLGAGTVLWPWGALSLALGDYKKAIGLMIIYLVVLVARQVLQPKILEKQIGLHPLMVIMSMYIGLKVFGALGFILGPIVVIILKAFQKAEFLPKWK